MRNIKLSPKFIVDASGKRVGMILSMKKIKEIEDFLEKYEIFFDYLRREEIVENEEDIE